MGEQRRRQLSKRVKKPAIREKKSSVPRAQSSRRKIRRKERGRHSPWAIK